MDFLEKEIKENYFKWIEMNKELLENILSAFTEGKNLEKAGKELYNNNIGFSKFAILLDKYSYKFKKEIFHQRRNKFALGYIKERLPKEVEVLKLSIHNNPSLISQEDLDIIDELFVWLSSFIDAILYDKEISSLEDRVKEFEEFINTHHLLFFQDEHLKEMFIKANKELYECAREAFALFKSKEYYFFTLVYIEMISLLLKLISLLGGMFLESELLSLYVDPITLLPNRFQLQKDLRVFGDCYILIVNIKGFSKINVIYGFEVGDVILKKSAEFLKNSFAIKSYRIYGDEFAVLLHSKEEIEELMNTLNSSIKIKLDGIEHSLFFYGAYTKLQPKALEYCEFVISQSDKKGVVEVKDVDSLLDKYKKSLSITQKLKEAMIQDNIIPYFQPIYVTKPIEKVLKYEVLMRIKYEDEILSPGYFLDALKDTPFYTEFTKSILLKSFNIFKDNDFTFSVNFTLLDIKDKNLLLFLKMLFEKYPDVAKRLTIEITEAEALKEFDLLNKFMQSCRIYGVRFALDDFGSGYSNFAQFAKLDIDFVKIDGSIVKELLYNVKMQKLLDSILSFAKGFDIKTIAEFVSNKELFDYLKDKVDMLQGYYIGEPKPYL